MNTKLLGALGEQAAAKQLRNKGYKILSANYSTGTGELDIVAEKDNIICFVEVKTRTQGSMFSPKEAVDLRKQENIISTASAYMARLKSNKPMRFDIVEVIIDHNGKIESINHIENAF